MQEKKLTEYPFIYKPWEKSYSIFKDILLFPV